MMMAINRMSEIIFIVFKRHPSLVLEINKRAVGGVYHKQDRNDK